MKILVFCQYYYPEQFKITEICERLVSDGHTVTVVTGLPNYPEGIVPKEYRFMKKRKEIINGVKVLRNFLIPRKKSTFCLALNYVSYVLSSCMRVMFLKKEYDLVFVYQLSPVTMALPGILYSKLAKCKLYLYCCDIWPESIKTVIKDVDTFFYKVIKKLSEYIYSNCQYIGVSSMSFLSYLSEEHGIDIEKIKYIPQHSENSILYREDRKISPNGIISFVFMGNIGKAQNIDCIIKAVELLKERNGFKVHFVGSGSYYDEAVKSVNDKKLNNMIVFHGRFPQEKMQSFYDLADVCLLTLRADNKTGLTVPSKLQGYMATGKMVLASIDGDAKRIIEDSGCGICVPAGDYVALSTAMLDIIVNYDTYKDYGARGRDYFQKNFTIEKYIEETELILHRLKGM
ncbi:MAG: glycosyltransferase family 4 protein [Synergistaceae bacterium]